MRFFLMVGIALELMGCGLVVAVAPGRDASRGEVDPRLDASLFDAARGDGGTDFDGGSPDAHGGSVIALDAHGGAVVEASVDQDAHGGAVVEASVDDDAGGGEVTEAGTGEVDASEESTDASAIRSDAAASQQADGSIIVMLEAGVSLDLDDAGLDGQTSARDSGASRAEAGSVETDGETSCVEVSDCGAGQLCEGNRCTRRCATSADCRGGARCVAVVASCSATPSGVCIHPRAAPRPNTVCTCGSESLEALSLEQLAAAIVSPTASVVAVTRGACTTPVASTCGGANYTCRASDRCAQQGAGCEVLRRCVPRTGSPGGCLAVQVCGCDGNLYGSACEATDAGVNTTGPCTSPPV